MSYVLSSNENIVSETSIGHVKRLDIFGITNSKAF